MARANPQWQEFASYEDGGLALAIFSGPHAYVSPRFYSSDFNVPTWNYTAVHLSGNLRIESNPEHCLRFIADLTARFEPGENGWKFDNEDPRYLKLIDAIIVFEISIKAASGAFKLNQNKGREDQLSVIKNLRSSAQASDHEIAALMEANFTNQ